MFQSTAAILVTGVVTFIAILACCLRKNPLTVVTTSIRELGSNRLMLFHLLGCLSILIINKLEIMLEPFLKSNTTDWTPYIQLYEEKITPLIQQFFLHPTLTYFTTYFYVIVFSVLMFSALFIYHYERDFRSWYALIYGISFNYFLAIPFFLFSPVQEAWYSHPDIRFLIPEVYPNFEEQYRHFSGLDNSFPSLHTSISITMAAIAFRSRNRMLGRISILSAGIILFAILYLGIHWYLDLIGGVLLASISTGLAFLFCELPIGNTLLDLQPKRKTSEQISHPLNG
ncbi:phosphatase PAP2 family protein [Melghirimyces algeriensis]|uniref:PAP2 superfamily protein n=1 Tax=Melghirimyces algeriensis TaxID=910412 RepID=A0A521AUN9_9BACL|nr:phosphatase PAP2 family protein [Melghirimyces algeriensis]SMO38527.1 PAP2 superfamily protein [Melghirimyces algeriensis]